MKTTAINTILTISVFLVVACVHIPETSVEKLQGPIPQSSGIVVAEVINNSERIVGPINHWQELILWRDGPENEDNTFSLSASELSFSTQRFVGAVPEGTYRVGMLFTSVRRSDVTYYARAIVPPALGTFVVKPGHATNLGTILYHPFQLQGFFDKQMPDYVITRVENPTLWDTFKINHTNVASHVATENPLLSWTQDKNSMIREDAANKIMASGLATNFFPLQNGEYAMIGLLGTLLNKNEVGWERASTIESRYRIMAFIQLENGTRLIGGEYGLLARSVPPYERWETMQLPDPGAHVVRIGKQANSIYVITQDQTDYDLYWFDGVAASLKHERSFPLNKDAEHQIGAIFTVERESGFSVFAGNNRFDFQQATAAWTSEETDNFISVIQQGNGKLFGQTTSFWLGQSAPHYSDDKGQSWVHTKSKIDHPPYITQNNLLIAPGSTIEFNLFPGGWTYLDNTPVIESKNSGLSWDTVGSMPRRCENIVHPISTDEHIYVYCASGDLLLSDDLGRSWNTVYERNMLDISEFPKELRLSISKLKEAAAAAREKRRAEEAKQSGD